MPGYLLFCGCMVGYLISLIWAGKSIDAQMSEVKENILKKIISHWDYRWTCTGNALHLYLKEQKRCGKL